MAYIPFPKNKIQALAQAVATATAPINKTILERLGITTGNKLTIDGVEQVGGTGGATTLSQLTDVDSTNKVDKKILQYNGTTQKNEYVDMPAGGAAPSPKGSVMFGGSGSVPGTKLNYTNTTFTIEMWIKPNSSQSTRYLFNKTDKLAVLYGYVTNSVELFSTVDLRSNSAMAVPLDGNWHHICYSYDSVAGKLLGFVDGVKVLDVVKSVSVAMTGTLLVGAATATTGQFSGRISELRFWKTARTIEEIQANWNKKIANPQVDANLLLYYKMDEPNGTIAVDSSANPENLTLSSAGYTSDGPPIS